MEWEELINGGGGGGEGGGARGGGEESSLGDMTHVNATTDDLGGRWWRGRKSRRIFPGRQEDGMVMEWEEP